MSLDYLAAVYAVASLVVARRVFKSKAKVKTNPWPRLVEKIEAIQRSFGDISD